jgi:hypothetical protein
MHGAIMDTLSSAHCMTTEHDVHTTIYHTHVNTRLSTPIYKFILIRHVQGGLHTCSISWCAGLKYPSWTQPPTWQLVDSVHPWLSAPPYHVQLTSCIFSCWWYCCSSSYHSVFVSVVVGGRRTGVGAALCRTLFKACRRQKALPRLSTYRKQCWNSSMLAVEVNAHTTCRSSTNRKHQYEDNSMPALEEIEHAAHFAVI